jgi:hypothetical protein
LVHVVSARTRMEAWLGSAEFLFQKGDSLNVILNIADPVSTDPSLGAIDALIDEMYLREKQYSLHTVAETIFPGWEYVHRGIRGVYDRYPAEYAIFKRGDSSWGRYAERLIVRKDLQGNTINPLRLLIDKLRWARSKRHQALRARYEIGIVDGPYDLPLYDGTVDENRLRGAPCLMHLSFKLVDDQIHLTALYRSHDYRYKVPGNLLGLARLQACVAQETGSEVGTLVVHSTLAYVDRTRPVASFEKLLDQARIVLYNPG